MFGRSFNEIGNAILGKIYSFNEEFEQTGKVFSSWNNSDSIWKRLYPSKEDIQSQLIDIESVLPKIDENEANKILSIIKSIEDETNLEIKSFQELYDTGTEQNKWIAKYAQETKGQIRSTEGVIQANQQARTSAIAHNEALKQQTLGAKAAAAGMKLLAMAGNMIAMWAVTKIITKTAEAINNYIHRVEKAREKLEETTSELESIESEIKNINSQIDELLAKEDISIIDENEIKRLQLENAELENRRKILEAIAEEESAQLNEKIEDKWKKDYQQSYHVVSDDTGDHTYSMENWLNNRIDRANELLNLQRALTEEEQQEFSDIKTFLLDEGKYISENTEGYKAVTAEQRAQKAIWEDIIADIAYIGSTYPGTVQDVTDRLVEKFGYDTGIGGHKRLNKGISDWINSLTPEEKRIMVECELERATLIELKQYLSKNIGEIEKDVPEISISFNYNELENLESQVSSIQSAYDDIVSAIQEYNKQGFLSMSTIDSLIALDDEYINSLIDENGQLQYNAETFKQIALIKLEEAKSSIYQEACLELVRIKELDTALAAQELALANGTLTESAYETAKALYNEVVAMGGANAALAENVWSATTKKVALLDNQIQAVTSSTYDFAKLSSSVTPSSEILDKEITALEKAAEAGTITYKEYLKERERLVNDYYNRGLISAEEYYAELEGLAQAQVDYYDKVLAAVERRFDREIDKIQDTIDAIEKQNELLEKQKDKYDSALDAIQDLIDAEKEKHQDQIDDIEKENDAIQNQIDEYDLLLNAVTLVFDEKREAIQSEIDAIDDRIEALQKENDEHQKQIELEKAKDALLKARNQRTKYLYAGEGKGFIYQADTDAIAEAEQTLSDLTFQSTIDALEKEKELLADVIEQLDETEKKWQEISNAFDDQKAKSTAQELFGDDYENIILNGDPEMIASVMNQYTSAQQKLEDNESLIASIEEEITKLDELGNKWTEIATEHEKAINREHAAALLGAEWEKIILEDRQVAYDTFKTNYLSIQAQIDDNTSLIESYNEKIEYYNGLKEQWKDIADEYQKSVDDQILKQQWGEDAEAIILENRGNTINDFKDVYVTAQQELAKAAEESAERQYQAALKAKEAQDMLDSSTNTTSVKNQGLYKIVDKKGELVQGNFSTRYAAEHVLETVFNGDKEYKIQEYHTGLEQGYVGGSKFRPLSDDERLNILRRASIDGLKSNEVPAILQKGELVLTKDQIKGITNSLVAPDYYGNLANSLSSIPQGILGRESNVTQHITVTLPNITNTGGYENFVRAINQLGNDALQFSKRN